MKRIIASAVTAICLSLVTSSAFAQFGGLGLGSSKGESKVDPEKIEAMLKEVVVTSLIATSKLNEALGDSKNASAAAGKAECLQKDTCGVKDATGTLSGLSESLGKKIEAQKASGEKLSAEASKKAMEALLPAVKVIPLWALVTKGGAEIAKNPFQAAKAPELMLAVLAVPDAMATTISLIKASIDYLSFSGADVKDISTALKKQLGS